VFKVGIQNIRLQVKGMSCQHCVNNISETLSGLEGIGSSIIDLETKTVNIDFDPAVVRMETIIDAIEELGYDVSFTKK
jgi:copper chaperone